MSAQLISNASQYEFNEAEPAACLNDWPVSGWKLITTPSRWRYVQLQQRAEHFENRHFNLAVTLMQLRGEHEKGISRTHPIARLEGIAQKAQQQSSAALAELFAESDRLRAATARGERDGV